MDIDKSRLDDVIQRIDRLESVEAIRGKIYAYCRGADRADPGTFASAFWPDGHFVGGGPQGKAEEFIPKLIGSEMGARMAATQHVVGNIIVDIDGDFATSEAYAIAYHKTHPGVESNEAIIGNPALEKLGGDREKSHLLIVGFRYIDLFERRSGEWRILQRRIVFDWTQAAQECSIEDGGLGARYGLRGAHQHLDPLYELLGPGNNS